MFHGKDKEINKFDFFHSWSVFSPWQTVVVFRDFIFFPTWLSPLAFSWIPLTTVPTSEMNHLWAPLSFPQQDRISHYEPLKLTLCFWKTEVPTIHHQGGHTPHSVIGALKTVSHFLPSRILAAHKGASAVGRTESACELALDHHCWDTPAATHPQNSCLF